MLTKEERQKVYNRASKTIAKGKWLEALRIAHSEGHHGDDVSGYWALNGCTNCI